MIHKANDAEDALELLEHADNTIKSLYEMMKTNKIKSIDTIYDETIESMKTSSTNNGIVGASTGLSDYDTIINGLQPTFVYVIATRPGMGKSALMKSIAKIVLTIKLPVQFIA